MIIYGIDPGLANLGLARVQLYKDREKVLSAEVFSTKKDSRKQVRAADDNARRCVELASFLLEKINSDTKVIAFCCEAMSWPRNSSNVAKIAMAWGIITTLSSLFKIPILQVAPMDIKKSVTGIRDASKENVQVQIELQHPEVKKMWCDVRTKIEHQSDAVGAALACLGHEVILASRRFAFPVTRQLEVPGV